MEGQQLLGPNGLVGAAKEENDIVRIYWATLPFLAYHEHDTFEKRYAMATLAELGVEQKTIGELFGVRRRTVHRVDEDYRQSVMVGRRVTAMGWSGPKRQPSSS